MHTLWVQNFILPLFDKGKDLEIRVFSRLVEQIKRDDVISFNGCVTRRVLDVRRYDSFTEMLRHEDENRISPGSNKLEILHMLQSLYPKNGKRRVYVFELGPETQAAAA